MQAASVGLKRLAASSLSPSLSPSFHPSLSLTFSPNSGLPWWRKTDTWPSQSCHPSPRQVGRQTGESELTSSSQPPAHHWLSADTWAEQAEIGWARPEPHIHPVGLQTGERKYTLTVVCLGGFVVVTQH